MGITISPESEVVTATTGSSWYDHIQAWHDWIDNTSSHWNITDFTDDESGASGDKGFITAPTTGNLDFEMRIMAHSQSSAGVNVTASLDPGGNISTVASATTKANESAWPSTASQDPIEIFTSDTTDYHSGSLISSTDESLSIVMRAKAGGTPDRTPEMFHGGDIWTPVFSDDPDQGLDGLGYIAGNYMKRETFTDGTILSPNRADGSQKKRNRSRFASGSGDFQSFDLSFGGKNSDSLSNSNIPDDSGGRTTPFPVPVETVSDEGSDPAGKFMGHLKYMYLWNAQENALDKLEGADTEGFVFLWHDGNKNAHFLVPWNSNKNPKA